MTGKCPKCDAPLPVIRAEQIKIQKPTGAAINGVSYSCPHCHVVLSVETDPVSLHADLATELRQAVRKEH
jgi:hypothetical protein